MISGLTSKEYIPYPCAMPTSWSETSAKPARQYVIGSRRCRQRLAQKLGRGLRPAEVAAIERRPVEEVAALLEEPGFQELAAHYAGLNALPEAERRSRLVGLARAMLGRLVACGDLRAICFALFEEKNGRHPAGSLAGASPHSSSPAEASSPVIPDAAQRQAGIQPQPDPATPAPPPLPAWLDQVDARIRQVALRLPEHELAFYLRRVGRFYGFDTS
jgi:hypothetical protein